MILEVLWCGWIEHLSLMGNILFVPYMNKQYIRFLVIDLSGHIIYTTCTRTQKKSINPWPWPYSFRQPTFRAFTFCSFLDFKRFAKWLSSRFYYLMQFASHDIIYSYLIVVEEMCLLAPLKYFDRTRMSKVTHVWCSK